jgi:hypothetical protein
MTPPQRRVRATVLCCCLGVLGTPAGALEASGSITARTAYGAVLEKWLFTEIIARAELSHRFASLEGLSFKLGLDPALQVHEGRTRFEPIGRYGLDELYLD